VDLQQQVLFLAKVTAGDSRQHLGLEQLDRMATRAR
jgi:hypothetical protein